MSAVGVNETLYIDCFKSDYYELISACCFSFSIYFTRVRSVVNWAYCKRVF